MTERPARPARSAPPEIAELRRLKRDHPELASAAEMQIALVEMQRRIQARVPLPRLPAEGVRPGPDVPIPLVGFADIPIDWTDLRLALRQTADILHRFDAIDADEHERLLALGRDPEGLEPLIARWYTRPDGAPASGADASAPTSLDQVLVLALRPFLARCVEALQQNEVVESWQQGRCPVCGWEPDFAVITRTADRRLVCGRCLAQWSFEPLACPFCGNDDRSRITSFATRDGLYRVSACDVCHRYLKAYDARHASRPVLLAADTIATLPLDAAAMQRGYTG